MRSLITRSTRRLMVGFSIIMLLLCQTAAAALSYAATPPVAPAQVAAAATDTVAPCHHDIQNADDRTPTHGCPDRCPSRDTSFDKAKIDIPTAAMLVLTLCAVNPPDTSATVNLRYEQVVANAASPPLLLVYCRLLI